ncbi:putative reverse transcriptase zinc-binding domain-containing protein [Helianthus annuus]|nr:putative reverse transcriptase zinc-binding domain-containing protein [Helianthus annuus]KAJ0897395.1 putative reverse transcriptase zinc-binding domain-containing protein [Helianthus annuus]
MVRNEHHKSQSHIEMLLPLFRIESEFKKSCLYGVGVGEEEIEEMAEKLNCSKGKLPFNFLGLTIGANMKRVKNWKPVIDKFNSKLSAWKANCLSFAGRMVLAKAVTGALPNYYFSMYLAPKKVVNTLDAIRRDFIWGRKAGKHKIRWIAWDKMTRSKHNGSFGLGDLRSANLTFMIKWWWKYKAKPEELWTKVIKSIHDSKRCYKFLPINNNFAGIWKDIVRAGKELETMGVSVSKELAVELGNGKSVKLWLDNWIGDKTCKEKYLALFKIATKKHATIAESATVLQHKKQWNIGCDRPPATDEEWAQWTSLMQQLNSVKIITKEDRWHWKTNSRGEFSVATVRKQLSKIEAAEEEETWKYWNQWTPPKVNYFTWRVSLTRISVKQELVRRRIPLSNQLCSRCGLQEETVDHLICGYMRSRSIWKNILTWLKLPASTEFRSCKEVLEFVNKLTGSSEWKKIINMSIQATIWNIWKSRNDKEFEGYLRNDNEITETIKMDSFIWLKSRSVKNIVWERWADFNIRDIVR